MIGSLLLDQHNRYSLNGRLPNRPINDKKLLASLVSLSIPSDKTVLPPSMQDIHKTTEFTLATKISHIAKSNLLIVHRTFEPLPFAEGLDKVFRLDDFEEVAEVEIWIRKNL